MSKETLSEIKKDLPIPNSDDLVNLKINPVIGAAKSFQAKKNYGVNDHKLATLKMTLSCLMKKFSKCTLQQLLVFLGSSCKCQY